MTTHTRELFVNLPVRDLKRSMEFFAKLGFEFNPKFTDEKAACMIIGGGAYVMLLTHPFFAGFTKKTICDTTTQTAGIYAVSCASREAVDTMVKTALASGGTPALDPVDHGFMYNWSFCDPDGHHWEPLWMDPKAAAA
jgi:predicted lactoylglutathione lyase